jgi:hypothetical protein
MNPALIKRWKVSETLLKRAHAALPRPRDDDPTFCDLERQFTEYVEHNEYGLALDAWEELGDLVEPRGGFWKDLMRAAENMTQFDRIPKLQKKFENAHARKQSTRLA